MEFLKLLYPEASAADIKAMATAIVKNSPEFAAPIDPEATAEIDPEDAADVIAEYIDGIVQGELITTSIQEVRREAIAKAREIVQKRKATREERRAKRKSAKQEKRTTRRAAKKA